MPTVPQSVLNEKLASDINRKISNYKSWIDPKKQNWDRYYKLYRSYLERKNYPWQSNIFVPYAFSTVETIVPRLISTKPQIDIMPRNEGDEIYAEIQSKLIDFEWDQTKMDEIMPDLVRQALVYGTAIIKVSWDRAEEEVEEEVNIDPEYPELGTQRVKNTKVTKDTPIIELVDLYDFFWDPSGTTIENCSWVAHRVYRSYDYLLKMQKQGLYKNVRRLKEDAKKKFIDTRNDFTERQSTQDMSDPSGFTTDDKNENNIEVIEYVEDNKIVTLANRDVVIREEKSNPYDHGKKGFIKLVDQSVPKEFCGIGEIEPIETLQYELNDMRNQRMDNATMILNRMWIIENGANVDEDELVSDVGGVIHTEKIDGIQPVLQPEIPNSSYREENLIKADIQQATGITDYTKGIGSSDTLGNETATGISLLQEAGNARLRLKMMNLEKTIKDIGELLVSLNAQFITDEKVIRITGEQGNEWVTVKPEEVKDEFDVKVQVGPSLQENDAIKRKQAMEMYQLFAGDPDVNQTELKRRVFESRNEKNIDKLLNIGQGQVGPQGGLGANISDVPGGAAGLAGNSDLNASGELQKGIELNRGVTEIK